MGISKSFGNAFVGGGTASGGTNPGLLYVVIYTGNDLAYLGGQYEGVEFLTEDLSACDNEFSADGDWSTPADVMTIVASGGEVELPTGFAIIQHAVTGNLSFFVNYKTGINFDYRIGSYILSGPNDTKSLVITGTDPEETKTFRTPFGSTY